MRVVTTCLLLLLVPCAALQVGPNKAKLGTSARKAVAVPLDPPVAYSDVPEQSKWVANLDYAAFQKDVSALGKKLTKETGEQDVGHLNKILRWRNAAAIVGIGTMWAIPNPITVAALSTWTYASWTMGECSL